MTMWSTTATAPVRVSARSITAGSAGRNPAARTRRKCSGVGRTAHRGGEARPNSRRFSPRNSSPHSRMRALAQCLQNAQWRCAPLVRAVGWTAILAQASELFCAHPPPWGEAQPYSRRLSPRSSSPRSRLCVSVPLCICDSVLVCLCVCYRMVVGLAIRRMCVSLHMPLRG